LHTNTTNENIQCPPTFLTGGLNVKNQKIESNIDLTLDYERNIFHEINENIRLEYGIDLNEEDKTKLKNNERILSGNTEIIQVICPECLNQYLTKVEIEFIQADENKLTIDGLIPILCENCRNQIELKNTGNLVRSRNYEWD
jgi:hypothetical protein